MHVPRPMSSNDDESSFFLRDPVKLVKLILDSIPATVFLKDRESVYLGCNKQFSIDAGLEDPQDIVGKTDYDLAWKKEESDFFVATDRRVMESRTPEIGIIEPILKADGTESWLETNKVPLINEEDEVIGVFGTYKDITAKVEADEALNEYAKDLEFKNEELEQFAFIASHDLQEPLKTMTTLLQYFDESFSGDLGDEAALVLQKVKDSSIRMQQLIHGLLDYARIGYNRKVEEVDCSRVVDEVLLDLANSIKESGAVFEIGALPVLSGSKAEIRSLFQNLISNAIKFRSPGAQPKIVIESITEKGWHQFSISDNGIGIDKSYHDKIFKIYQRLNKRSEYDGSGIGLTHCRKIIELHKGRIWFENAKNGGTVFKFTLPKDADTN